MPYRHESVHSAMKSVSASDLIVCQGMNSTSYWLISTTHYAIHHVASLLCRTCANGQLIQLE
jgi:hypothetical protein